MSLRRILLYWRMKTMTSAEKQIDIKYFPWFIYMLTFSFRSSTTASTAGLTWSWRSPMTMSTEGLTLILRSSTTDLRSQINNCFYMIYKCHHSHWHTWWHQLVARQIWYPPQQTQQLAWPVNSSSARYISWFANTDPISNIIHNILDSRPDLVWYVPNDLKVVIEIVTFT